LCQFVGSPGRLSRSVVSRWWPGELT
jgi:hypothetical protein